MTWSFTQMNDFTPPPITGRLQNNLLQRACACGQHTNRGGCSACEKERQSLQRSTRNWELETESSREVPPIVHEVLRSSGQPLDASARAFFEPRFGHDFSHVRVHAGARAAESARAVNALAYTVRNDLVFGTGQYAPATNAGQKLLAHELTHVIQQSGLQSSSGDRLVVSSTSDVSEQAADRVAAEFSHDSAGSDSTALRTKLSPRHPAMLFRQTAEGQDRTPAGGDRGNRQTGTSDWRGAAEFTGLCLRTPFGPGTVRFSGCSPAQLSDYAVIPEKGTTTSTPVNGVRYDSDGFWFRHHLPKTEWFKVGDHCDLDVTCEGQDFSYSGCCNAAATLIWGTPDWSHTTHRSTNPF